MSLEAVVNDRNVVVLGSGWEDAVGRVQKKKTPSSGDDGNRSPREKGERGAYPGRTSSDDEEKKKEKSGQRPAV